MRDARWMMMALLAGLSTFSAGCNDDEDTGPVVIEQPGPDLELIGFLDREFGLSSSGFGEDGEELVVDDDGFIVGVSQGQLFIDGFGERTIELQQRIEPAAAGGEVFLQVRDVATDAQRFFLYDFDARYIVFGEDTGEADSRGVGVQPNPDGTYEVWTFDDAVSDRTEVETVADGYAAMRRVEALNGFAELPPHIIMAAYALGQTAAPEARSASRCFETAATPAACSIFKAFCDCVACRILERSGDCRLCPQL